MKDITYTIDKVEMKKGKSKAGTEYTYIEILLINGGKERIFLNNDSLFKWENAVSLGGVEDNENRY